MMGLSYESEPINMNSFCLFDKDHRSSKPLNMAYKAAQLSDAKKADAFLIVRRFPRKRGGERAGGLRGAKNCLKN